MMKIYFAGSIRGGRTNREIYQEIIAHLQKHGEVLTEHIASKEISDQGEFWMDDKKVFASDLNWLINADIIVAEVTTPSLGVGFEVATSVERKKPVLCLYRKMNGQSISAMIRGCPQVSSHGYEDLGEAKKIIDAFIDEAKIKKPSP